MAAASADVHSCCAARLLLLQLVAADTIHHLYCTLCPPHHALCAPGTGKTSSARLLSRRAALPLVYVPLEALVSKWYGESEQNMAKVRRVWCTTTLLNALHKHCWIILLLGRTWPR
jgi:hypothetical protein